jgi:hypothetical protein
MKHPQVPYRFVQLQLITIWHMALHFINQVIKKDTMLHSKNETAVQATLGGYTKGSKGNHGARGTEHTHFKPSIIQPNLKTHNL